MIRERVSCSDHNLEGGLGLCWGFQLGDSPPAFVKGWQHVQCWVDTLCLIDCGLMRWVCENLF